MTVLLSLRRLSEAVAAKGVHLPLAEMPAVRHKRRRLLRRTERNARLAVLRLQRPVMHVLRAEADRLRLPVLAMPGEAAVHHRLRVAVVVLVAA